LIANPNAAGWNTHNLDELFLVDFWWTNHAMACPVCATHETTAPKQRNPKLPGGNGHFPTCMMFFLLILYLCFLESIFGFFWGEVAWQLNLLPVSQPKEGESNVRGG